MNVIRGKPVKLTIAVSSFLGGLAACYLLVSMGVVPTLSGTPSVPNDQTQSLSVYLSFVGVILTSVTVILAALAIGIGVVAAYTISEIKSSAKNVSREVSENISREVSMKTSQEVSEVNAKIVAADALSEVKIKSIVEEYFATYARERNGGIEWGAEGENDDR